MGKGKTDMNNKTWLAMWAVIVGIIALVVVTLTVVPAKIKREVKQEIMQELQRDYCPGPYTPGYNPDKIDPLKGPYKR